MNSKIKYVLGAAVAVLSLAVIAPSAETQLAPPPYHSGGLTIVPTSGYGAPVVIAGPNGMQRVTPNLDPNGYFEYDAYSMPPTNLYNVSFGPTDIPRTSDAVSVRKESNNRLFMQWQGEPRAVRSITFALLDTNNKVIRQQVITDLPAEARLTRTTKTTGYRVTIQYINGTVTNMTSPLM
ncbi:MAG TPA: hypothetical protein VKU00_19765 [Chthonomonadaceae bacterium]|nr:hypothetical protein [Chthonomonadaceae bacterium]